VEPKCVEASFFVSSGVVAPFWTGGVRGFREGAYGMVHWLDCLGALDRCFTHHTIALVAAVTRSPVVLMMP